MKQIFLIFLLMFRHAINCLHWILRWKKKRCSFSILFDLAERLTFQDVESPQEFRYGETAEVVCDVISSPVPVVVWYYQDKEITEEHHSKFSWPSFTMKLFPLLKVLLLLFSFIFTFFLGSEWWRDTFEDNLNSITNTSNTKKKELLNTFS